MALRLAQTVTTKEQMSDLVEAYSQFDQIVIDLETMPGAPGKDALHTPTNRVFWIGLAGPGRCDAIPMGHPNGRLIEAKHTESVLPPEHERKVLASGKTSMAKKKITIPNRFAAPPPQLEREYVLRQLKPLLFSDRRKVNQNIKFDMKSLAKYYGGPIPGPYSDFQVAAHILDENRFSFKLGDLVKTELGYSYEKLGSKGVENFAFDVAARYTMYDARVTHLGWQEYTRKIKELGFEDLLEFESRVTHVLYKMELEGVTYNYPAMEELAERLDRELDDLKDIVFSAAGYEFNMNAAADKGKFIYEVRGHKPWKWTTKTKQPSTEAAVLESYADADPVVQSMMDWTKMHTVRSTFIGGMEPFIHEGVLHGQFNQHRTVTGRLSSSSPNLQNIPRYDPDEPDSAGSQIRKLFKAPPGYTLVVADYDQIELRIMAYFSQDPIMLATFQDPNSDIHRAAAAAALAIAPEMVTREQRSGLGKPLNFAMGYGAGATKVAAMTGLPLDCKYDRRQKEWELNATDLLDDFQKRFAQVFRWKDNVINEARARDPRHVETFCGRWRRLPDLKPNPNDSRWVKLDRRKRESAMWKARTYAERQAVNTVVQGSGAEIMKLALIRLDKRFAGTPFRAALTIHDEIVSIAPYKQAEECKALVVDAMGGIDWLDNVPLVVSSGIADTWADAK